MAQQDTADNQRTRLIYDYAAGLMKSGLSDKTIQQKLVEFGVEADAARQILIELRQAPQQPRQRKSGDAMREIRERTTREAGVVSLVSGALIAAVGVGITLFSYQNAARTGGFFLITYGLIFAGLAQFARGLIQITTGKG